MLSIQEMVNKTEDQRQRIKRLLGTGTYHPKDASLLDNQKPAVQAELRESLQKIPLSMLLEFLAKQSGTGGEYLFPEALHTKLIAASYRSDRVPQFAAQIVNGWKGGDLAVDIAKRQGTGGAKMETGKWSLHPKFFSSGGKLAMQTVETVKATISPVSFGVPLHVGMDLVEDTVVAPDLITWHVEHAAQQLGQFSTDLALVDIFAHADGDGTANDVTAGADTTTSAQVLEAVEEVGSALWNPNTLICTHKAWADAICVTASHSGVVLPPPPEGYDAKFQMLDVVFNNSYMLYADVTSNKMTNCDSVVLDRSAAYLCGRKRWMKLENYADPVHDLQNAIVTCRQDGVTLYKDAICTVEES